MATFSLARRGEGIGAGIVRFFWALEVGARNAVAVSIARAAADSIVGVVGLTGLGVNISSIMIAASGGDLILGLALVLIASLVLGMGLPVTATNILLILHGGPGPAGGVRFSPLIAHLLIFW